MSRHMSVKTTAFCYGHLKSINIYQKGMNTYMEDNIDRNRNKNNNTLVYNRITTIDDDNQNTNTVIEIHLNM